MNPQIAAILGKALIYLWKKNPDAVDAFMDEVAKRIPGKLDDKAIEFLKFVAAMFKNLA